jgi:hypothetical protein
MGGACQNKHQNNVLDLEIIVADIEKAKEEVDVSFLVDPNSAEIVILETNQECLIGEVTKVHIREDKILVYDELTTSVFVFNKDGSYHSKIHALGQGPGEYPPVVNDMVILKDKVGVLLPVLNKIMFYDFEGKYIGAVSLQNTWGSTFFTFDDLKYFIVNDWSDSKQGNYHIFTLETGKTKVERLLPFSKDKRVHRGWGLENYYSLYQNRALILFSTEDVIYEILQDEKEINPRYQIDIPKRKLPKSFCIGDGRTALQTAIAEKYLTGANQIMETSQYIILDISNTFRVIYDKLKKETVTTSEMFVIPEFGDFPVFLSTSHAMMENDRLINVHSPEMIRHVYPFDEKTIKNQNFAEKYLEMVNKLSDDDNPVLIIYNVNEK